MSGHSKWSKIKRIKELKDKKRGNIFGKLSKLITLAVVEGGGISDPNRNVKLRFMIEKAKHENMPKENIERAVGKASGTGGEQLKEVIYEAFGIKGVALLIIATTDNPNRTTSEVKNILDRHHAKLGSQGSVSYLFQHCDGLIFSREQNSEEAVFTFAEGIGATDFDEDEENLYVYIPFHEIGKVKDYIGDLTISKQDIEYKPTTLIELGPSDMEKIMSLVEALEDLDDVHNVYANAVSIIEPQS